ncbi:MAG TPA: hypothetical protein VLB51_18370 [Methylomirabilota bacterium]|nr:hypothetical protein [Methylomirabilota bacterium]
MTGRMVRVLAAMAVLAVSAGCLTYGPTSIGLYYYLWGPDAALRAMSGAEVGALNRALVELERAVVLLELGRYGDSLEAVARAGAFLDETAVSGEPGGAPAWRPAPYERVLMRTVEMAAHLALQDAVAAAEAADRALATAAGAPCEGCGYAFTRTLTAIAYAEVGRFDDGLAALAPLELEGEAGQLVSRLRQRLTAGVAAAEPAGLAPPPVPPPRALVAILLLGRGPDRVRGELEVGDGTTLRWPRVVPRDPQAVAFASFEVGEPAASVELTDVNALATASLRAAGEEAAASVGADSAEGGLDLRHWSTLPASLQLLELELAPDTEQVELVYWSPYGVAVDGELIDVPPDWPGGRLFLTRRMP